MGLKEYNEEDGIVTSHRRDHNYFEKTKTENGEEWAYLYEKQIEEEVTEWPALSYEEARAKIDDYDQPGEGTGTGTGTGTGSIFQWSNWEMMEEQREVGSYILIRTSSATRIYFINKYKMEKE